MHEHFGRYILLERIAIGGMAEIFKAKAPGLGGFEKILAIKRLHPRYSQDADFIEMLIDEARITVELSHSNIGQIFDLGKVEDHYFIAMEFIDGRDLYRVMKRLKDRNLAFPMDAAAYVAAEACAGLDYAHRKKDSRGRPLHIVHRDVSPQNVLLSYEGDAKLVDFGIAKAALRAYETESGIIKGKFYYMSPEQARGETLDHRTDIFSLGIVLYEALTGDLLYKDDDEITLLSRVRRAEIEPPSRLRPEIPRQLEAIVMKALARDREERYPSAQHMQRDLARFLRDSDVVNSKSRVAAFMRELFLEESPVQEFESESLIQDRVDFVQDRQSVISIASFEEEEETSVEPKFDSSERSKFESDLLELGTGDIELVDANSETWVPSKLEPLPEQYDSIIEHPASDPFEAEETRAFEGRRAAPVAEPRRGPAKRPEPLTFNSMPTPVPGRRPAPAAAEPRVAAIPALEPTGDGFNQQPTVIVPPETGKEPMASPRRGVVNRAETPLATPVSGERIRWPFSREHTQMGAVMLGVLLLTLALTSLLIDGEPGPPSSPAAGTGPPAKVTIPTGGAASTGATATLKVASEPNGAKAQIDGVWCHESTPTTQQVPAGRQVVVKVALENYQPWTKSLVLKPGEQRTIKPKLEKLRGTLSVTSSPPGATVLVNGNRVGVTPHTAANLPLDQVLQVKVTKADFEPYETTVQWGGAREKRLDARLEPVLDELQPIAAAERRPKRRVRRAKRRPRTVVRDREPPRRRDARSDDDFSRRREASDWSRRRDDSERGGRRDDPPARRGRRDADRGGGQGYLSVSSKPWGSVFINDKLVLVATPLIKKALRAGSYRVKVCYRKNRRDCSGSKQVTLSPGEVELVKFSRATRR